MEQAHDSQWAKDLKSVHNLIASTASAHPAAPTRCMWSAPHQAAAQILPANASA
jgi:hypothetical protein